jgi:DNA-binding SARP family transcriptional activator/tetratricopeptide (TPR) repeat protein
MSVVQAVEPGVPYFWRMADTVTRTGTVRVHLFGSFEVEGFADHDLGSRKARRFLKAIALGRGRPVAADRLVDIVWGDEPPARPGDQLSVLASRLRRVLGAERIEHAGGGYALRADWFDLDEVEQLAADAGQRQEAGSAASTRAAAGAALRLVRGELLADEPDADWLDLDRRAAARLVGRLTAQAAEAELDGGDPAAAAVLAEQGLDADPYDETALRLLMRAHRASGRPASALSAYASVRERLRDELGVSPSAETEALHTEILLSTDEPTSPATEPTTTVTLAARGAELRRLDAELGQVRSTAAARIAIVRGEAGIGKSVLLERWRDGLDADDVTVLVGWCDEFAAELPLQAVLDALARHLDRLEPTDVEALLAADRDVLDPLLGRTATAARPGAGDTGQAQLFASLLSVLARAAADRTVVLVIDDFHLAGESTRDWLRFFARRGPRSPILVVLASRLAGDDDDLDGDATIELGPLDRAAAAEIVGNDRADELLARSGGNPLFLVELANAPDDQDGAPPTIRAAVSRRLRQVGPAATTLATAAVLGPSVDLDLVAATSERPAIEVLDDLEVGARAGFLEEQAASFVFRHSLVREAMALDVSAARRAWLHRAAARVLDARRPAVDPAEIVHHARLGGEDHLAARALVRTADLAMNRFAYAEARRLLDEAIELHDDADARLLRGRVHIVASDFEAATVDANRAIELGAGPAGFELAAWAGYYRRDLPQAEANAFEGARRSDDPLVRASCLTVAGRVIHGEGQLHEADAQLSEAIALGGHGSPAVARIWLASLRIHQSHDAEGLELAGVSPSVERDPIAASYRHIAAAHALGHLGRPVEALVRLDELDRLMDEIDFHRYQGASHNWRAWLLRYLGDLDRAAEQSEMAGELAHESVFDEAIAHSLLDRADLAMLRGDLGEAAAFLDRAAPYHERQHTMRWRHALRGRLLRAHLAVLAGDLDAGAEDAAAVDATAAELGVERYRVLAGLVATMAGARSPDGLESLLDRLPVVAGTEAWWWTARVARTTGDDRWRRLTEHRTNELVSRAGERSDRLPALVERVLNGPAPSRRG